MVYTRKATDKVYSYILQMLDSGEWKPGDRILTEEAFRENLQVSRVAVRQAIERLTLQHRLKSIQGSGTYVCEVPNHDELNLGLSSSPTYDELLNILEFRKYYECAMVELCIKNGTERDLEEINHEYQVMLHCGNDMKTFYTADYRFHEAIAKGTKQRFIYSISRALSKVFLQNQEKLNYAIGPNVGLEYHKYILLYIQERDIDLATAYMRKHMDTSISELKKVIEQNKIKGKERKE